MSIPIGARVHHTGCKWNVHFTEEQRQANHSWALNHGGQATTLIDRWEILPQRKK